MPAAFIVLLSRMVFSRRRHLLILLAASLLYLVACQQPPETAKVIQIIDGDTIVVEGGYYVRYIGIDAPEKNEPFYLEAMRANREMVMGREVRLECDVSNEDKYGRLLRYVYVDSTFVNAELVKQGYACAKAYPPDIKHQADIEAMEEEAKQLCKGIWRQQ